MIETTEPMRDESPWPIRSMLYIPATRVEWVAKGIKSAAEAIILDLEDAVGAKDKPHARALIPQEINELRAHGVSAFFRPNQMSSGGVEDILACVRPGLTGIILPKATVDDVTIAHDVLSYAEGRYGLRHNELCIVALPETASGIRDAYDIAKASTRTRALFAGVGVIEGDTAWSCGFRPTLEGHEQLYIQSKVVLDSRAAGLKYAMAAIFSPQLNDLSIVETMARRAKHLGFTGGAAIHPSHVAILNAVFRPTDQEVEHYQGLIDALEDGKRTGHVAVRYKGAMIDLAMEAVARDTVNEAARRPLPPK